METLRTKFTFTDIVKVIKGKKTASDIVDAVDIIVGSLLLLSPVATGPTAIPLYALIGPKNEATRACKKVIESLGADGVTELTRYEKLATAYSMLCYAAFFEAVEKEVSPVVGHLSLSPTDHVNITAEALSAFHTTATSGDSRVAGLGDFTLEIPHPNDSIDKHSRILMQLYQSMARKLERLIRTLVEWDEAEEHVRDQLTAAISDLPESASELYPMLYFDLCNKFNEFAIWASLREHSLTRTSVDQLAADVRTALELYSASKGPAESDIGLNTLAEAVRKAIPPTLLTQNLNAIEDALTKTYTKIVDMPVIADQYQSDEVVQLTYPKKSEIFIPQAFRAIKFDPRSPSLEDESLWSSHDIQEDIGQYIMAYLSSPYSTETPMVILGHPGSGKSLLTELLAARLAAPEFNAVRVKLRDVNPDAEIQTQIEEQIRIDTGRQANWAEYISNCHGRPPLVILDGYDELLQASGRVFSTFLMSVASFQKREIIQDRPVRVIVTSRITLIDKAEVPPSSIIVRLEEFDAQRRDRWIAIWNSVNKNYFEIKNIKPLRLPNAPDLLALAGQPLLLLMLALFDSESNELARHQALDQTNLYYSLLMRFINRERGKGTLNDDFREVPEKTREAEVRDDLQRLGAAAIGMLNRRAVHISKTDLNRDIEYFGLVRTVPASVGAKLDQAELLLGSFFFVHESRSRLRSEHETEASGTSAFEFLHNTFGEFLAADWLLTTVLEETEKFRQLREPALESIYRERLDNKDALPKSWFATLMATPLYDRPLVIQMLKEWSKHRLAEIGRTNDEFSADFESILYSHLHRIFVDAALPEMLLGNGATPYPRNSVIRNIATYAVNLVLLRCVIGGEFVINPLKLDSGGTASAWSQIVNLWFAGLGIEGLVNVSAVLSSSISIEGTVSLATKESFSTVDAADNLVALNGIAKSLGDEVLLALSGWAIQDAYPRRVDAGDLVELRRLPWVAETAFGAEISARSFLRDRASRGFAETTAPEDVEKYTTTSTIFLEILHHHLPSKVRGVSPTLFMGNSELSSFLGGQVYRRSWSHLEDLPNKLDDFIIRNRPLVAADAIYWWRDAQLTSRPLVTRQQRRVSERAKNDTRSKPELENRYRSLGEQITAAAVRAVRNNPSQIAMDIRVELLASGVAEVDAVATLRDPSFISCLKHRPSPTVESLIKLSDELGQSHWIYEVVAKFGDREQRGVEIAMAFGAVSTLALLAYVGEHPAGIFDFRDKDLRLKMNLSGIAAWALDIVMPEERRSAIVNYLRLVERSPAAWLSILRAVTPEVVTHVKAASNALTIAIPPHIVRKMEGLGPPD